jgi:hypothetical protein
MPAYSLHKRGESKMARYFFHIASEQAVMQDHHGRECSCAEDAFFHARRMVDEAARYLDETMVDGWSVSEPQRFQIRCAVFLSSSLAMDSGFGRRMKMRRRVTECETRGLRIK